MLARTSLRSTRTVGVVARNGAAKVGLHSTTDDHCQRIEQSLISLLSTEILIIYIIVRCRLALSIECRRLRRHCRCRGHDRLVLSPLRW